MRNDLEQEDSRERGQVSDSSLMSKHDLHALSVLFFDKQRQKEGENPMFTSIEIPNLGREQIAASLFGCAVRIAVRQSSEAQRRSHRMMQEYSAIYYHLK